MRNDFISFLSSLCVRKVHATTVDAISYPAKNVCQPLFQVNWHTFSFHSTSHYFSCIVVLIIARLFPITQNPVQQMNIQIHIPSPFIIPTVLILLQIYNNTGSTEKEDKLRQRL